MIAPRVRGPGRAERPRAWGRRLGGLALLAPPVAMFVVLRAYSPDFRRQAGVVLGQAPRRYADHASVAAGAAWDLLFVVVFAACGIAAVFVTRHLLPPFRRCRRRAGTPRKGDAESVGPWVDGGRWWSGWWWIVGAAGLDAVENGLLFVAPTQPPGWFADGLAVLG